MQGRAHGAAGARVRLVPVVWQWLTQHRRAPARQAPPQAGKDPELFPARQQLHFYQPPKIPPPSPRLRNQHRVQGTWLGVWVLPASLEPAQPPLPCASVSPSAMTAGGGGVRNVTLPCVLQRGGSICYK